VLLIWLMLVAVEWPPVQLLALLGWAWLPFELIIWGGQDWEKKRRRFIFIAALVGGGLLVNFWGTLIIGMAIGLPLVLVALIIQFVRALHKNSGLNTIHGN
jgi:hypothetical protein